LTSRTPRAAAGTCSASARSPAATAAPAAASASPAASEPPAPALPGRPVPGPGQPRARAMHAPDFFLSRARARARIRAKKPARRRRGRTSIAQSRAPWAPRGATRGVRRRAALISPGGGAGSESPSRRVAEPGPAAWTAGAAPGRRGRGAADSEPAAGFKCSSF
jgi:hypothetical protein